MKDIGACVLIVLFLTLSLWVPPVTELMFR